jgi:poly(hydroxyalkanoate) granule-associated protein
MAKAQEQGSKAIEALVNDGLAFQRKSQAEAQQRLSEATERLSHIANDFGQQASGRVDRLEHLFEDRVAKALHRLGIPTLQDFKALNDRILQLETMIEAETTKAPPKANPTSISTKRSAPRTTKKVTAPVLAANPRQATTKTRKVTSKPTPQVSRKPS